MARYLTPQGEVEAFQVQESMPSGGKKGDWSVIFPDGKTGIAEKLDFETNCKQKFPRAVEYEEVQEEEPSVDWYGWPYETLE